MASLSPPIPLDMAATGSLGPVPTPTHGQPGAGSFTIACSAHIKATPPTCLEVLLKASEYPTWNRYCRKCIIDAQPDGNQPKNRNDKKSKSKTDKNKSNPKSGKPGEPVGIPVAVAVAESSSVTACIAGTAPRTLSPANPHSSEVSSASSVHQALPNLVGPGFLRLGTKFTFHVHMDPLSEDSSARNTALEVSRLERIDEVVKADVSSVLGSAASLPSDGGSGIDSGAKTGVTQDNGRDGGGDGGDASGAESQNNDPHPDDDDAAAPPPPAVENIEDDGTSVTTAKVDGGKPSDPQEKDEGKVAASLSLSPSKINNKLQLRRTGFRIAWKTRPTAFMPNWMLRCERVQEFVEIHPPLGTLDEPETAYQCWETFYGVLAPVVKAAAGSQIVRGFDVWMEGLKKRAEGIEGRGERKEKDELKT
ncbi:hypothetical protein GE21DRAFT_842 [Neurospora crassa]|uniref:Uncharacterized protein n=2 Tax=Neurospora crassa TaxID=5141 RepID=Q7SH76_NEUCR|nr:hypothetical protein NCU02652 [Neurospora crassa OR74A]EAA36189.2 hypothetical protein NCU02652 [Neurospora crassa OR74A]KHE90093.1 hypothetical protein GE21DRAFT_842 [Neurospora crassa]CAE76462.1 hypothetical protein [Neurospora crassa]|eukprot:XP_965425.2 hypothetical protein NCU02652 [Neurospora crassa OR74A]